MSKLNRIESLDTRETLRRAHEIQQKERIPKSQQNTPPNGSYNAFVLFNLEAAFDEGHAILGLGVVGGALDTFSYYRQGNKIKAPALVACLKSPKSFLEIEADSGWIQHGSPGNYWNEHFDCALALTISENSYKAIFDHANKVKNKPGIYDLIHNNCLSFVKDSLKCGEVILENKNFKPLETIIPKDAFKEAAEVAGANKFGEWKYWFPVTPAPNNDLRSISDLY